MNDRTCPILYIVIPCYNEQEVLPITAQTADSYALVYSNLRRTGRPIPTNDLWIAASALEHGAALLTRDSHFGAIDGLRCGQQLEDFLP